jgi:predicted lipoprotein
MSDGLDQLPASIVELLDQPDGYQKLSDFADQVSFVNTLVEGDVGGTTQLGGGFNALDGD